jgi:hypothetical protein
MPLLPGKSNIGHNVKEMEQHGHPKAQAVAAALHTALDDEEVKSMLIPATNHKNDKQANAGAWGAGQTSYNQSLAAQAKRAHGIVSYDESGTAQLEQEANALGTSDDLPYKPVTTMTLKQINDMGHELWAGPHGNVGSDVGNESSLPQSAQKPIPVYPAGDEVSPAQSDPPDRRNDNLLTGPNGANSN